MTPQVGFAGVRVQLTKNFPLWLSSMVSAKYLHTLHQERDSKHFSCISVLTTEHWKSKNESVCHEHRLEDDLVTYEDI